VDLTAPFTEPNRLDTGEREITARWITGPADDDWRPELVFTVRHHKRFGYRATLVTARIRQTPAVLEELFDPLATTVVYNDRTTERFSNQRLHLVYTNAMAELRRLVRAGHRGVLQHLPSLLFEPMHISGAAQPVQLSARAIAPTTVADIQEGQTFSLDSGSTWHTCATPVSTPPSPAASTSPMATGIAVYATHRRDRDARTAHLPATPELPCWLLISDHSSLHE
jgi:hypothetical protein